MTACSDISELDPLLPVDRDRVETKVRFLMGGVSTDVLSSATLLLVSEECILKFEDSQIYETDVTYCTLLDVLQYLIRQSWTETGSDVRGSLKSVSEKEGNVAYKDEYESSGQVINKSGWEKLYDYFLINPQEVAVCLAIPRTGTFGLVSIGGTQQDKYIEIENNSNSKSMWGKSSIGSKFSAQRESRRRQTNYRSKTWRG